MRHRMIDVLILGVFIFSSYSYYVSNSLTSLMFAVGSLAFYLFIVFGLGRLSFWKILANDPELGLKLLEKEDGVFFENKPTDVDVVGPFKLFARGQSHIFFIKKDEIDQIQQSISNNILARK